MPPGTPGENAQANKKRLQLTRCHDVSYVRGVSAQLKHSVMRLLLGVPQAIS